MTPAETNNPTTAPKSGWRSLSFFKRFLIVCGSGIILVALLLYLILFAGLPDTEEIKAYQPKSIVTAGHIDWSKHSGEQPIRIWAPIAAISPLLQTAVIISEDDLFYQHDGVNFDMMKEAWKINWQKKRYVRGASTITMQLARNAFLTKRKTIIRKVREIILARRIESCLKKRRILELYLNIVEWGDGIYGAEAASRYYFGKAAASLNLNEATLLASMLPNPKYFNPFRRLSSCRRMQKRVLELLQLSKQISAEQVAGAESEPPALRGMALPPPAAAAEIDSLEELKYLEAIPTVGIEIAPRLPRTESPDSAANQPQQ